MYLVVTGKDLVREIKRATGAGVAYVQRQARGSHVRISVGSCRTSVPVHAGQDLPPGTLRSIVRDLEPCLGEGWNR